MSSPPIGSDGLVFLTGATGFVGSHVLQALLNAGYEVRALVRAERGGDRRKTGNVAFTRVTGDLARPGELTANLYGCRYLVHVAAQYSFSPASRATNWRINVAGTRGLLEAARIAGVERAVVTSSSATVGPARDGVPATEEDLAPLHAGSGYHQSKVAQERAALASQLPAVLVLPTTPVGPGDWRPTPTGKTIVDFMRGRIFASLEGGLNVVPIEDVARAHVLALQRGRDRERYLLGGENLPIARIWEYLGAICSRAVPRARLPYELALSLSLADEVRCRLQERLTGHAVTPAVPIEGVRMARHTMFVDDSKARRELGYTSASAYAALERAVHWYRDNGYAR